MHNNFTVLMRGTCMLFMFCFGFKLDMCSCAGKLSTLKLDLTEPQRIIYCFDYLSKDRGGTHTHTVL